MYGDGRKSSIFLRLHYILDSTLKMGVFQQYLEIGREVAGVKGVVFTSGIGMVVLVLCYVMKTSVHQRCVFA